MLARLAEAAASPAAARYGPIAGDDALREAYAAHLGALYGGDLSAGRRHHRRLQPGLLRRHVALAQRGDAVLLPTPWYFNHGMTLDMLGIEARPLPCRAEAGFVPDPEEAAALIDERVRAIVLVTPNNPTGAVYPPEVIAALPRSLPASAASGWCWTRPTATSCRPARTGRTTCRRAAPGRTTSCSSTASRSPSRSRATGSAPWRRRPLFPELGKVMDCVQICASRAGQAAVAWGLGALADWRAANRAEMNGRAAAVRAAFARLPGWRLEALGAYFAYVRHPFGGTSAWEVAHHWRRSTG